MYLIVIFIIYIHCHSLSLHSCIDSIASILISKEEKVETDLQRVKIDDTELYNINQCGETLLMLALKGNDVDTATYIVNRVLDLRSIFCQEDDDGNTAFLLALKYNYKNIVHKIVSGHEVIIRNNNYLLKTNNREETAIFLAVMKGHTDMVKILLNIDSRAFDINDLFNYSPLDIACFMERLKVIEYLIDNPNINNMLKSTALVIACKFNLLGIVELLLKREDIDVNCIHPQEGHTALTIAIKKYNTQVVYMLLARKDININYANIKNDTPFMVCLKHNYEDLALEFLKRRDLEVEHINNKEQTPLLLASRKGYHYIVQTLLKMSVGCINQPDIAGYFPLEVACIEGHTEIVNELILAGANINQINVISENSVLMTVCLHNRLDIVKILLSNDNINIGYMHHKSKYTAIEQALLNNNLELVSILLDKLGSGGIFINVLQRETIDTVYALLEKCPYLIDLETVKGNTILHFLAEKGRAKNIHILWQKYPQLDIHKVDKYGWGALHFAAANGHIDVIKILLEQGVDIDLCTYKGGTALAIATQNKHSEAVKYLLSQGAKDMYYYNHDRPFTIAYGNNDIEIIQIFLDHNISPLYQYSYKTVKQRGRPIGNLIQQAARDKNKVILNMFIRYFKTKGVMPTNEKHEIYDNDILIALFTCDYLGYVEYLVPENIIKRCIKKRMLLNKKPLLHHLILKDDVKSIKLLVKYGENIIDSHFLALACKENKEKTVRYIVMICPELIFQNSCIDNIVNKANIVKIILDILQNDQKTEQFLYRLLKSCIESNDNVQSVINIIGKHPLIVHILSTSSSKLNINKCIKEGKINTLKGLFGSKEAIECYRLAKRGGASWQQLSKAEHSLFYYAILYDNRELLEYCLLETKTIFDLNDCMVMGIKNNRWKSLNIMIKLVGIDNIDLATIYQSTKSLNYEKNAKDINHFLIYCITHKENLNRVSVSDHNHMIIKRYFLKRGSIKELLQTLPDKVCLLTWYILLKDMQSYNAWELQKLEGYIINKFSRDYFNLYCRVVYDSKKKIQEKKMKVQQKWEQDKDIVALNILISLYWYDRDGLNIDETVLEECILYICGYKDTELLIDFLKVFGYINDEVIDYIKENNLRNTFQKIPIPLKKIDKKRFRERIEESLFSPCSTSLDIEERDIYMWWLTAKAEDRIDWWISVYKGPRSINDKINFYSIMCRYSPSEYFSQGYTISSLFKTVLDKMRYFLKEGEYEEVLKLLKGLDYNPIKICLINIQTQMFNELDDNELLYFITHQQLLPFSGIARILPRNTSLQYRYIYPEYIENLYNKISPIQRPDVIYHDLCCFYKKGLRYEIERIRQYKEKITEDTSLYDYYNEGHLQNIVKDIIKSHKEQFNADDEVCLIVLLKIMIKKQEEALFTATMVFLGNIEPFKGHLYRDSASFLTHQSIHSEQIVIENSYPNNCIGYILSLINDHWYTAKKTKIMVENESGQQSEALSILDTKYKARKKIIKDMNEQFDEKDLFVASSRADHDYFKGALQVLHPTIKEAIPLKTEEELEIFWDDFQEAREHCLGAYIAIILRISPIPPFISRVSSDEQGTNKNIWEVILYLLTVQRIDCVAYIASQAYDEFIREYPKNEWERELHLLKPFGAKGEMYAVHSYTSVYRWAEKQGLNASIKNLGTIMNKEDLFEVPLNEDNCLKLFNSQYTTDNFIKHYLIPLLCHVYHGDQGSSDWLKRSGANLVSTLCNNGAMPFIYNLWQIDLGELLQYFYKELDFFDLREVQTEADILYGIHISLSA